MPVGKRKELPDHEHKDMLLLYEVSTKNLEFFKRQQWQVAYYSLLIHGAIAALRAQTRIDLFVLSALAVLNGLAALALFGNYQRSISAERDRQDEVAKKLSESFERIAAAKSPEGRTLGNLEVTVILRSVIVAGIFLALAFVHFFQTSQTKAAASWSSWAMGW